MKMLILGKELLIIIIIIVIIIIIIIMVVVVFLSFSSTFLQFIDFWWLCNF